MQGEPTKCPYREVCQCPGLDLGEGDWKPVKGFIRTEEGILCLDWDIAIPLNEVEQLRIPEGRHIVDAVVAADKIDAARRRWSKSLKRREAQKRYEDKDKGQATVDKYQDSEKFKLAQQKYYFSKKGQKAHEKRKGLVRDFKEAAKWLQKNPGKTYEDYLKETKSEG